MAEHADDRLVINTEIDTSGFRKGYAEIQQAMASLSQSVERNGQNIGAAFTDSMNGASKAAQNLDALIAKQREMQADPSVRDKLKQWDDLQKKIEETAARGNAAADALSGKATAEHPEPPKRGTPEFDALKAEYFEAAKSMRELRDEEAHMERTDIGQTVREWERLTEQIEKARDAAREAAEQPASEPRAVPAPAPGAPAEARTAPGGGLSDLANAMENVKELTTLYNRLTSAITSAEMKLSSLRTQQADLRSTGAEKSAQDWNDLQEQITKATNDLRLARQEQEELARVRASIKVEKPGMPTAEEQAQIKAANDDYRAQAKIIKELEEHIAALRGQQKELKATGADKAAKEWDSTATAIRRVQANLEELRAAQTEAGRNLDAAREEAERIAEEEAAAKEAEREARAEADSAPGRSNGSAWQESIQRWQEAQGVLGHLRLVINEVGTGLARMSAALARVAWKGLKSGARAAADGIRSLTKRIREHTHHANLAQTAAQTLTKSLTRIKTMLLTRVKRTFISYLFKTLTSSVQALAKFDKDFDNAFSNLRNRASELGANIVVSFGTLIKAVEPFLTMIIAAASKAVEALNGLIASITGAKTATRAIKQTKSYAESLDSTTDSASKAAEAQKKLNETLTSYDELHKLNGDTGADESGSTGDDGSNIYEAVNPDTIFSELPAGAQKAIDRIREAFAKGNWAEVGKAIGHGLNDAVQWLDSQIDPIAAKASLTAAKIAQAISGVFETFNGYALGEMLAHGLNAAVTVAYNFLRNINFQAIGQVISDGLEGLFLNIDYQGIGQVFAMYVNGIIDTVYTVLTETDWYGMSRELANGLNTFISGVNWAKLGATIGAGINTITSLISGFVQNFDWAGAAAQLAASINGLFSTVDWNAVGHTLGESIKGVLTFITTALEQTDWYQIGLSIATFLRGVDWSGITSTLGELLGAAIGAAAGLLWGAIQGVAEDIYDFFKARIDALDMEGVGGSIFLGILQGIGDAVIGIGKWIYDNVLLPIVNGIKSVFGIHSPSTVMAEYGGFMADGLLEGITAGWANIVETVKNLAGAIFGALAEKWDALKEAAAEKWAAIKDAVSGALTTARDTAAEIAGNIHDALTERWEALKTGAAEKWTAIKETVGGALDAAKTKADEIATNVKDTLTNSWESIKTTAKKKWDATKNAISSALTTTKNKATEIASSVKDTLGSKWEDIKTAAKTKWDDIKAAVTKSQTTTRDELKGTDYATVGDSMVAGIKRGTQNAWGALQTTAVNLYGKTRGALQTTDFVRVGTGFVGGIKSGITSTWNDLKTKAVGLWGNLREAFANTRFDWVGSGFVSGIRGGITDSWGSLKDKAVGLWGNLRKNFMDTDFWSVGRDMVSGLANGIWDSWSNITNTIWNGCCEIYDEICDFFDIGSPSKVMHEIGGFLTAGLDNGIQDTEGDILQTVTDLSQGITDRLQSTNAEVSIQTAGNALEAVSGLAEGVSARLGTITAEVDMGATAGLLGGLDAVADRLGGLAESFQSIAKQMPEFLRIGQPQVAEGTVVPAKTRVSETAGSTADLHGIRSLLEQLLEAAQAGAAGPHEEEIKLICDGRTLAEAVRRYDVRAGRIMNGGAR